MIDMLPPLNVTVTSKNGVRVLTPEEIETVKPIFESKGVGLPNPANSVFVGMVEDGKVIAFLVLQIKLHAEPMWIAEGRSNLFKTLVAEAEKYILQQSGPQWVYLFAPAGRISQLAQSMGMQLEPWNVLSKLIVHEVPEKSIVDLSSMPLGDSPSEEVIQ